MKLDIELGSLPQCCLDTTDLSNLRTNMEMNQAQTVTHILLVQQVESLQKFRTGQSEF